MTAIVVFILFVNVCKPIFSSFELIKDLDLGLSSCLGLHGSEAFSGLVCMEVRLLVFSRVLLFLQQTF